MSDTLKTLKTQLAEAQKAEDWAKVVQIAGQIKAEATKATENAKWYEERKALILNLSKSLAEITNKEDMEEFYISLGQQFGFKASASAGSIAIDSPLTEDDYKAAQINFVIGETRYRALREGTKAKKDLKYTITQVPTSEAKGATPKRSFSSLEAANKVFGIA